MPRPQLLLDGRDLAPALRNSCGCSDALFGNLVERAPVAVERRFLPRKLLPSPDNHVNILRIEFHGVADTIQLLGRNERGAGTAERLISSCAGHPAV